MWTKWLIKNIEIYTYNVNQEDSESEENVGKMDRVCEVGTGFTLYSVKRKRCI
jgi:hypothetical protein